MAVYFANRFLEGRHDEADTYSTGTAAKGARQTMSDERKLKATLPSASLPAGCTPGKPERNPIVPDKVTSDWFPKDAATKATARCGPYYAYMDGNVLYAWVNQKDAPSVT